MTHYDPEAREREARAEMAATAIGRPLAALLVGAGLAIVAAGPALELAAAARGESAVLQPLRIEERRPGDARVLPGVRDAIDELEQRFDERSALVRAVRPPAQALLTRALGWGNEQTYLGRAGWLHYRPDFDHLVGAAAPAVDAAAAVIDFRDQLAARGVALVVLPAPVKLAIEPERFVRRAPAPPLAPERERKLLGRLAAAGVAVLDPAPLLAERSRAAGAAYLAADTHWRPEAMDEVARALAVRLRAEVALPPGDATRFRAGSARVAGRGDLRELLGIPAPPEAAERVETAPVTDAAGNPWRPRRGAPVLLLGDSFTAVFSAPDLGWGASAGLAERLAFHLGLDVDRIVRNAGGAVATRRELAAQLARDPARLDGVRIVVWQFAAREISQGEWESVALPPPPARGGEP